MFVTLCGKKPLSVSLFTARSSSRLSLTQTIYAVLMASVSRCAQKSTEVSKYTTVWLRDSQILSRNLPPINLDRRHVCGMDDPAAVRSRCECRFSCVGISPLARSPASGPLVRRRIPSHSTNYTAAKIQLPLCESRKNSMDSGI